VSGLIGCSDDGEAGEAAAGAETTAFECPGDTPTPVPPTELTEVDTGQGAIGSGALWTVVGATEVAARREGSGWVAKVPWFRLEPGELRITGTRLDGEGELTADLPDGYPPTGFQPSGLRFSTDGCWEIVGRLNDSEVTVHARLPAESSGG
jgi:hypothetical protein